MSCFDLELVRKYLPSTPISIISCGIQIDNNDAAIQYDTLPLSAITKTKNDVLLIYQPQKINLLQLFNQALQCLREDGVLIIIDHFVTSLNSYNTQSHTLLSDFLALAERFNFHLITQNQFDDAYTLLVLKRGKDPKWRLGLLTKTDITQMLALFEKTFFHKMSPDLWKWKYRADNAPIVGIWEEQQLIASLGAMPRDILFFGQKTTVMQIGDVMVDAKKRGILSRTGPFFRMTATLLEQYAGFGKPFLFSYGFPNKRHIKLAKHLGLYTDIGSLLEFSWPVLYQKPQLFIRSELLNQHQLSDSQAAVNKIWNLMAHDLKNAAIGYRDYDYLQQRYCQHPEKNYQFIRVSHRLTGKVIGFLVIEIHGTRCDLIDLIAPLKKIPTLILQLRFLGGTLGFERLYCQISDGFKTYFQTIDYQQENSYIPIGKDIWCAGPHEQKLVNHWWLMTGDMDCR